MAGPLVINQRKEWATVGTLIAKVIRATTVWPGYPWLHAAYNGWDNALRRRKAKQIA
jgi:hypothetical protein